MSLTALLDNRDVKDKFREEFEKPWFTAKEKLLAPPLTDHYSLVGRAFDYLLRFHAQRLNREVVAKPWIAEYAAELLGDDSRFSSTATTIIRRSKKEHLAFLRTGRFSDGLLRATLLLAQLDPFFRAGVLDEHLGRVNQKDVRDLRNLMSVVRPRMLKAKRACLLNPTFGKASQLVEGADVDFVVDDMLIDVKTTKNLEMGRDIFNQLIGYYVLYRIGGIDALPRSRKIKRLGIYFSRYGYLHVMRVCDIVNEGTLPRFVRWFRQRARKDYARPRFVLTANV